MNDEYILVERSPSAKEFQMLHKAVGWGNVDFEATEVGLSNSLFSVCVISKSKKNVIGCGRLVGDGGIYFYIQDVIVLPEFQGIGIGKLIMKSIMDYLNKYAPPNAFVGLMAAKGVSEFYLRYDFMERPADAPGMFKIWKKQ